MSSGQQKPEIQAKPGMDLEERAEQIKKIEPFSQLDEDLLYRVASGVVERKFPKGSLLVEQSKTSKQVLFLLVEGKVEVFVTDNSGKETVTGYRGPGDFFGETTFLSDEEYPGSVRALEDIRCLLVPQDVFEQVVLTNSEVAVYFTRLLTSRLRAMYEKFSFYEDGDSLANEPLRRKVADVMVTRPLTCSPDDGFRKVASMIHENNVSSVIVVDQDKPLGIITEGDLVALLAREQDLTDNNTIKAKDLMSSELVSVSPEDFSYRSLFLMIKHRTKHLPVVEDDKLAGIVTLRDLIKSRRSGSLAIVNRIESRSSIEEIAQLQPDIDQVLQALLAERATVLEITSLIAEFYDRITRKIIEISEQAMIDEGRGAPPTRYCFIEMGSGGRKEQFTRTDQDNGIIYEDVKEERKEEVKEYFLALGEKIVAGLEAFGFIRCSGFVMANNEKWCKSFKEWRETLNHWNEVWEPETFLDMNIFLDFRYVYGHKSLYYLLRNLVVKNFRNADQMISSMIQRSMGIKVPLSLFRKILTERSGEHAGQLNLKSSACVIIVDCMRAFALKEGLFVTNTFERIDELGKREVFTSKDVEFMNIAYETLMLFRIKDAVAKRQKGLEPDNYIDPNKLSNHEYALLRDALVMVNRVQGITKGIFPSIT